MSIKHLDPRYQRVRKSTGTAILNWIVLVIFLFPIFWMILSSFKTPHDIFAMPPKFLFNPTLKGYIDVLTLTPFKEYVVNSLIVCSISVFVAMVIGTFAAYVLNRYQFKGKDHLAFWIISTRMAPPVVAIVPFFFMTRNIGLYDTHLALIIVYLTFNIPFTTWMMMGYISQVPRELDEAALVEGCNRYQTLYRIIVPLIAPGLVSTAIMSFIFSWNEFLFAFLLTGNAAKTVPVGIAGFITQTGMRWDELTAAGTLVMLPILVFSLFIQRFFIKGLFEGALKG